eukprot:953-Heterococcus_DN1.PRE.6
MLELLQQPVLAYLKRCTCSAHADVVAQLQPENSATSSSSEQQESTAIASNSNTDATNSSTNSSSSSSAAQCPFAGAITTGTSNINATDDSTTATTSGSIAYSTYSRVTADGAVAMTECPLGFGSKKNRPSYTGVPRINLQALALHAGGQSDAPPAASDTTTTASDSDSATVQVQKPRLLSLKGKVYDVSSSAAFGSGGPLQCLVCAHVTHTLPRVTRSAHATTCAVIVYAACCPMVSMDTHDVVTNVGHDASRALATSDYQLTIVLYDWQSFCAIGDCSAQAGALDKPLAGITFDEHKHLEQWHLELQASFPLVALLSDSDYASLFNSANSSTNSTATTSYTTDSDSASSSADSSVERCAHERQEAAAVLHSCIDARDAAGLEICLQEHKDFVNSACPRTRLSPLHKAVETCIHCEQPTALSMLISVSVKLDIFQIFQRTIHLHTAVQQCAAMHRAAVASIMQRQML